MSTSPSWVGDAPARCSTATKATAPASAVSLASATQKAETGGSLVDLTVFTGLKVPLLQSASYLDPQSVFMLSFHNCLLKAKETTAQASNPRPKRCAAGPRRRVRRLSGRERARGRVRELRRGVHVCTRVHAKFRCLTPSRLPPSAGCTAAYTTERLHHAPTSCFAEAGGEEAEHCAR